MKKVKAQIIHIWSDKWGNSFITIKRGKAYEKYHFEGIEGKVECQIYIPEGMRAERCKIMV